MYRTSQMRCCMPVEELVIRKNLVSLSGLEALFRIFFVNLRTWSEIFGNFEKRLKMSRFTSDSVLKGLSS